MLRFEALRYVRQSFKSRTSKTHQLIFLSANDEESVHRLPGEYFVNETIGMIEDFQGPENNVIKLFTAVIYKHSQ